jgi:hypothetical protein
VSTGGSPEALWATPDVVVAGRGHVRCRRPLAHQPASWGRPLGPATLRCRHGTDRRAAQRAPYPRTATRGDTDPDGTLRLRAGASAQAPRAPAGGGRGRCCWRRRRHVLLRGRLSRRRRHPSAPGQGIGTLYGQLLRRMTDVGPECSCTHSWLSASAIPTSGLHGQHGRVARTRQVRCPPRASPHASSPGRVA